jgi:hypothetical protein
MVKMRHSAVLANGEAVDNSGVLHLGTKHRQPERLNLTPHFCYDYNVKQ